MNENIKAILKEIEIRAEAEKGNLPIIGSEKGQVLVDAMKKYKPKRILEIGTLVGYSAILMGQYLPNDGKITTLEIRKRTAEEARENIKKAGLSDCVEVKIGQAQKIIPELEGSFDLVFIDASKNEYLEYLKAFEPKLSEKSVIVADNVGIFADEMKEFLEYVRNDKKYRSQTFDFGYDAVEVIEKI